MATLVVLSWALAGGFYLLDALAILFMGAVGDSAWLVRLQTRDQDLSPRRSERPASMSTAAWARSRLDAFAFGRTFAVSAAAIESRGEELAPEAAKLLTAAAAVLGIPAPPLFRARHKAQFLVEFSAYLDADPARTALALSEKYSAGHGELFRLGAALELQEYYARNLGQWAAANRLEVWKYGRRSGLPEESWLLFTRDYPAPLSAQEREAVRERALRTIEQHLANER